MSPLNIAHIDTPHFSTQGQIEGRVITLSMHGNADSEMKSGLEGVLRNLNREAKTHAADEIVLNMNELYFMTSSCISALVRWICDLPSADYQYRVLFRTNPSLPWQRRTLAALSTLAGGLARVE